MKNILYTLAILSFFACSHSKNESISKQTISIPSQENSFPYTIELVKGKSFNHPSFAIWTEDLEGNYLSTIYVTRSVSTSKYAHGHISQNSWSPDSGVSIRKAALPFWLHKVTNNNIESISPKQALVPDGYSSATPISDFSISSNFSSKAPKKIRVLMEINQAWDWNSYWHNGKYPDSFEYKTSAQPSIIYAVTIDFESTTKQYHLNPIGHGNYEGKDGNLYTNLEGFTTALSIIKSVSITLQ